MYSVEKNKQFIRYLLGYLKFHDFDFIYIFYLQI